MGTIAIDDRLLSALNVLKRSPSESYSEVIRRHLDWDAVLDRTFGVWGDDAPTAASLRHQTREEFDRQ